MLLIVFILYLLIIQSSSQSQSNVHLEHPLNIELLQLIKSCGEITSENCDNFFDDILKLSVKISNEYSMLLLHDRAKGLFEDILYYLRDGNLKITKKIHHVISILAFAQGKISESNEHILYSDLNEDLNSMRTISAQYIMVGNERDGNQNFISFIHKMATQFERLINNITAPKNVTTDELGRGYFVKQMVLQKYNMNDDFEDTLISFLLSEAQGGIRTNFKLHDLFLCHLEHNSLSVKLHFRLGVALTKLGLYDLGLRHISIAASRSDSALYQLRAKLIFAPIYPSIGALTIAVNEFERQIESVLLSPPSATHMVAMCGSFNEAALVLQSLPSLHVVGFAAPRIANVYGHLSVSLPRMLSEVYRTVCGEQNMTSSSITPNLSLSDKKSTIEIGIVAGSFDSVVGRIAIGLIEDISDYLRKKVRLTALCFPTPRSAVTDKVNALFDAHINLSPENKTITMQRIFQREFDFMLFADAAVDARVFALAHERIAPVQSLLWHWGGSLAIPTIDYYFMPEIFWSSSKCPAYSISGKRSRYSLPVSMPSASSTSAIATPFVPPQELFAEQVVLLQGIPQLPRMNPVPFDELRQMMHTRYLLDINNQTNIYFLPTTVKALHPEFDRVFEIILFTDPLAKIVIAVPRIGRDQLPATHVAVRHDLMQPAMPPAIVAKFRDRLRNRLGEDALDRVRILPPLDESYYRALQLQAKIVLDPFPVGLHTPILEALLDKLPVLSAPALQECTNSHVHSIAKHLNVTAYSINFDEDDSLSLSARQNTIQVIESDRLVFDDDMRSLMLEQQQSARNHETASKLSPLPTNAEDYAVLAVRIAKDEELRKKYRDDSPVDHHDKRFLKQQSKMKNHGEQLIDFLLRIRS